MLEKHLRYEEIEMLAREGVHYECAGDGLCCTDIHAIGALSDDEVFTLETIAEGTVQRLADGTSVMLMRADTGSCVFRTEQGCAIHAALGEKGKPTPCQRYPIGLTMTPLGGRVTTEHRCPCRHVGDRPLLLPDDVKSSLVDEKDELVFDQWIDGDIVWSSNETISFEDYAKREAVLLRRMAEGDPLKEVLAEDPFPSLEDVQWEKIASVLVACDGDTRLEAALRWVGHAIGALVTRAERPELERPWADAFDRASERPWTWDRPTALFADWVADKVWALRWTEQGSFARARSEFATQLAIARRIAAWLMEDGTEERLAIAEAITITDIAAHSDWWEHVQEAWPE